MTTVATMGKAPTATQRASSAAAKAAERFKFTDEKRMLAALSEIALDEMERNASFALRVRSRYEELAPQKGPRAARMPRPAGTSPASKPKLVPIKEFPGFELDATRPLDPWFIIEYFGKDQLETALRIQTVGNLRKAIPFVEERYPGTAPKGKVTKDGLIAYILEYALR